ncbi:MAG: DUF2267 domain-containing protein [Ktedonobacteraceae bacterium]
MKYDEFISQVQQRALLDRREEAEKAIHATLQTLGERLAGGETKDLASQLPPEMALSLIMGQEGVPAKFSLDEFFWLVSQREGVDLAHATDHARVVTALLSEVVTMGEIENVRTQLPKDFARLFEVENEGDLPDIGDLPEARA